MKKQCEKKKQIFFQKKRSKRGRRGKREKERKNLEKHWKTRLNTRDENERGKKKCETQRGKKRE